MKYFLYITIFCCYSCYAQKKNEKSPKSPQEKHGKIKLPKKLDYYFNLSNLKKNKNGLFCQKIDNDYIVIDGKVELFSYFTSKDDDNHKLIPYTCAKGAFLNGKYQGIWIYYDDKDRIIKKEKWKNGKLIYRHEYPKKH